MVVDPFVSDMEPFVVDCCVWGAGGPDWVTATTAEDSTIADGTAGTDCTGVCAAVGVVGPISSVGSLGQAVTTCGGVPFSAITVQCVAFNFQIKMCK